MSKEIIKTIISCIVNGGVEEHLEAIGINVYTIQPKYTKQLNIIFKITHTKINESDLMNALVKVIKSNKELFSIYGIGESAWLAHYKNLVIEFKYG